jgi:hypothetical protein
MESIADRYGNVDDTLGGLQRETRNPDRSKGGNVFRGISGCSWWPYSLRHHPAAGIMIVYRVYGER